MRRRGQAAQRGGAESEEGVAGGTETSRSEENKRIQEERLEADLINRQVKEELEREAEKERERKHKQEEQKETFRRANAELLAD